MKVMHIMQIMLHTTCQFRNCYVPQPIFWWKQVSQGLCQLPTSLTHWPVGQKIICQTKIVLSQLINFASLFYLSAIFENSETGHRSPMKNASHRGRLRASASIQEEQNYRRVHHHMTWAHPETLTLSRKDPNWPVLFLFFFRSIKKQKAQKELWVKEYTRKIQNT